MSKKVIRVLLIFVMLCLLVTVLVACSSDNGGNVGSYIISFYTDGGSEVPSIVVNVGDTIEFPPPPVKEGYVFIGWFSDKELKRAINTSLFRANSNATIFAGWESVETYPHAITLDTTPNGTLTIASPKEGRARKGTEVTIIVRPDDAYEAVPESIKAIGESSNIVLTESGMDSYVFVMPAEPVKITADFTEISHPITVITNGRGKIALSAESAKQGEIVTVRAIPDYGYRLSELFIFPSEPITRDYFIMRAAEVNIAAGFEPIDYDVEYDINVEVKGNGGHIELSRAGAPAGVYVEYKAVPDAGYRLLNLQSSGIMLDGEGFIMPKRTAVLDATFAPVDAASDKYTLAFAAMDGKVSAPKSSYAEGERVELTLTPDSGFELGRIDVNGTYVTGNEFLMPAENAVVTAEFVKRGYAITFSGENKYFEGEASATYAYENDLITFNVTPVGEDYRVNKISVKRTSDNRAIEVNGNSFIMPDSSVVIEVKTFAAIGTLFNISVKESENGKIIAPNSAKDGEKVLLKAEPEEGYRLKPNSLIVKVADHNAVVPTGASFIMPDADIEIEAEFEKVYSVGYVDEENIAIYPSATEMAIGDEVRFTIYPRGDYILSSVVVLVNGQPLTGNVFAMTEANAADVIVDYDRNAYMHVSASKYENVITYDKKFDGGSIEVPQRYGYYVKAGAVVRITIYPDKGYRLKKLMLETSDSTYEISEVFIMPASSVKLIAEFEEVDNVKESLEELYLRNRDCFHAAGIIMQYYGEVHQLRSFLGNQAGSVVSYVDSFISARSRYGHDFYVFEVKSLMKLNAVVQLVTDAIRSKYPSDTGVDVDIDYNLVMISMGGNAKEDRAMLENGIQTICDYLLYKRANGSYGVYCYVGHSQYVNVMSSYNNRIVSYIAPRAFRGASDEILGINLGNVSELDDYALMGLKNVRYAYLGLVSYIGKGVFEGCDLLEQ